MTFATLTFGENDETVLFTRNTGVSGAYPQPTPSRHEEEEAAYISGVGPISPFVAPIAPTDQERTDEFRGQDTILKTTLEVIGIQAGFADDDALWDAVRDAL